MRRRRQTTNIPNPAHINRQDPQHMAAADIRYDKPYKQPAPVSRSDGRLPRVFRRSRVDLRPAKHFFVETGHEIISTAILTLPLIQVGQLSVTGERMCTMY